MGSDVRPPDAVEEGHLGHPGSPGSVAPEQPGPGADDAQPTQSLAHLGLGTVGPGVLENAAQQKLQVLDLEDHSISSVPAVVYSSFSWVRVLDLRKNVLERLLPEVALMAALEELLLDQNRLTELPAEVCALRGLRVLSLSQNHLGGLPRAIGGMESLKTLMLGDNCLAELPAEVGGCPRLQTLYIHHNGFSRLPTSLGQLEGLREMALEWFRYTSPPLPRIFKGPEWTGSIQKLLDMCRGRREQGAAVVTCTEVLTRFSQKAFDPNAVDTKRRTRLHVACLEGHVGVAAALAEAGSRCDSVDGDGYSPLLIAVREERAEIAEALVRAGADVGKGGGLYGSPLHVATVNFDPAMVGLLIGGKADPNQTDADGNAPLHVLMSVFDKGHARACAVGQLLLRRGADCNLLNCDKWAPLHLAARRGQLRGICFALCHNDAAERRRRPAAGSHAEAPQDQGGSSAFDVNLRGGSHLWTPLHLSGHASHLGVVQVLVEAGADVFLRNVDSRTPRHVSRGNLAISKLLRKAEDEWLWYRLHGDAGKTAGGAEGVAEAAPERSAALDPAPRQPREDLEEAVEDWVRRVERMAEAPQETRGGSSGSAGRPSGHPSPMCERSQQRLRRMIGKCQDTRLLRAELEQLRVANFASPLPGIEEFTSSFTQLVQQGPKYKLSLLLSRPWARELLPRLFEDEEGRAALLQPAVAANEDVVRLLISSLPRDRLALFGKVRNRDRETWLHLLCKGAAKAPAAGSRADVLGLLLAVCPRGAFDFEAVDHRGQTPLHLAAQCGEIGLVQVLLEAGANPNAQEETTGWTPLHFAVSKGHYGLILQLLHHETANVNQVDKFDWPPLFEACSRLDPRSVALLANGGASLEFRNQHDFDVLRAVDTSKKDLPAKRWMSCLMVSNGFRFHDSTVQLNGEDRETLRREWAFFETREAQGTIPRFYVPDHLAPRCQACKVVVSGISARRNHCRSCGLVLCAGCTTTRPTAILPLDECLLSRQGRRLATGRQELASAGAAAEAPPLRGPSKPSPQMPRPGRGAAEAARGGQDSAEELEHAEELPVEGPPGSGAEAAAAGGDHGMAPNPLPCGPPAGRGSLVRDRGAADGAAAGAVRTTKLCSHCAAFHEVGVGETYSMSQRRGF